MQSINYVKTKIIQNFAISKKGYTYWYKAVVFCIFRNSSSKCCTENNANFILRKDNKRFRGFSFIFPVHMAHMLRRQFSEFLYEFPYFTHPIFSLSMTKRVCPFA